MHRALVAFAAVIGASAAIAFASGPHSGDLVRLSGWAEIPSTFSRPGSPVSGQFTTGPVNGVTPPYQGQPIPGFSGMIPANKRGTFIGLPDNGYGAQNNSADFVIGFYEVTPHFKTSGDGTTSRGPVERGRLHAVQRSERAARRLVHHRRPRLQPDDLLRELAAIPVDPVDSRTAGC